VAAFRVWFRAVPTRQWQFPLLAGLLAEEADDDEDDDDDVEEKDSDVDDGDGDGDGDDAKEAADGSAGNGTQRTDRLARRPWRRRWPALELVSGAADVLAWHRVLFAAIGDRPLTRAEAAELTNADAIAWLPREQQCAAREGFRRFARAFNRGLPLVENLYECQANPFVTARGEIDLSGAAGKNSGTPAGGSGGGASGSSFSLSGVGSSGEGRARMGFGTPVAFSLPSAPVGEVDAAGLCTPMLLRRLERAHNLLLGRFQRAAAATTSATTASDAGAAEAAASETETAPALSYSTPRALCERALLSYRRGRDLLPLLSRCSTQPLEGGAAGPVAFDGALLEQELARALR
jgi:hypothetical protein